MDLRIQDVLKATGGRIVRGGDRTVKGVSVDSRTIKRDELFFAIRGERFDGHDFVEEVSKKGGAGCVVERVVDWNVPHSFSIIVVGDTLKALGDLAGYIRNTCEGLSVVAVGGSTGKTTTKEMIASILSQRLSVLKTEGNRNNLIGLPLTLMGLDEGYRVAVVEVGINMPGEMRRLSEICSPGIAILTNIGRGHLGNFTDMDELAREKTALFDAVDGTGTMVVNLDDPLVVKYGVRKNPSQTITYTLRGDGDVRVEDFSLHGLEGSTVRYSVRGKVVEVRLHMPGLYNILNGCSAIAVALCFDMDLHEIKEGLESVRTTGRRMEVTRIGGITLVDDSYNANPESVRCALETLSGVDGRRFAVLGDMLELGELSRTLHREVGRLAVRFGVDVLFSVGEFSDEVRDGAISAGMEEGRVFTFREKDDALERIRSLLRDGDTVLVKGSRRARMEDIIEGLKHG